MVRSILFPAAVPEIFTGLRVGFSLTLIGTVLGEMFAAQHGLGYLLMNAIGLYNVDVIMSVTFLLVVFAAAVNGGSARGRSPSAFSRLAGRSRTSTPLRRCGCRRDRRAFDPVPRERPGDESRALHLLDEVVQVFRSGVAAARRAHRLVDRHEPARQQAQAGHAPRGAFELRLDAGDAVELPTVHSVSTASNELARERSSPA